jgi:hypothetical protein
VSDPANYATQPSIVGCGIATQHLQFFNLNLEFAHLWKGEERTGFSSQIGVKVGRVANLGTLLVLG